MENGEKYAKQIVNVVTNGADRFGIVAETNEFKDCTEIPCEKCLFCPGDGVSCVDKKRAWAKSEYIEKPKISKKDRAFLEYLGRELKYIVRSKSGNLIACQNIIEKSEDGWVIDSGVIKSLLKLNIDFPMDKWEDDKPWSIEELKNLEICETYEKEQIAQ